MKKLIIVRHGQYGINYHLDDNGRAQIKALTERLKLFVNGEKVLILTSPTDRARESAEIIDQAFTVGFEEHEILWSENGHPADFPKTLELIRSREDQVGVIILVTHFEYVLGFPSYYAWEELNTSMCQQFVDKGEAWVLDCIEKNLTHVKP